jgi:primosomal protein N' (replication factor Y)
MYAEVLVQYGIKALDREFTYLIPNFLKNDLKVGMKVQVPFGKTIISGFVIKIKDTTDLSDIREIISISDKDFILNDELLKLGLFIKENTLCSLIQAYQAMLPSSMKVKSIKSNYQKFNDYLEINNKDAALEFIKNNKRATKQVELLNKLLTNQQVLKSDYSSLIINKLLSLNLIKIRKEVKYRINKDEIKEKGVILTDEQKNAELLIEKSFNTSQVFLLYGITGSGKTEVYMNLIEKVIALGQNAIMLVPEISLTTQIVERFYKRFGKNVAIFHSALSNGEKYDEYHKVLSGDVKIIVGTRSAIFVPFDNIGIIILDEEQSSNYKQDNNPRYHARDIAIERSKYHNCPVVLGSATPSLESMARALKNVYQLITLDKRIGNAKLPSIKIVDMQAEYHKNNLIISDSLDEKIKDRLSKNEQVIILLNRRGFNTMINCKNCGYTFKCPYCDITLTYHKSTNNLRCHYCGYTLINPNKCPNCHEQSLNSLGLGTERLEEELNQRYPARIIRMDIDTTSRKGTTDAMVKTIEEGKADIIVGTQMISKGFDFPRVSLVGVINADESLNIPDFRSGERTFELLTQTAGRAGRKDILGEVIIQTFNPNNKTLEFVKNADYKSLFNYEMQIRKLLKYPPYYFLTLIKIASKDYDLASKEAKKVSTFLNNYLTDVIILGPTTSAIFKFNNVYRFQIILKYKNYNQVKNTLIKLDDIYKSNLKVNIEIDNNPSRV